MKHDHKSSQTHQSPNATEERVSASDHFWQSSIQCADRWLKKGNRDPASVIPARSPEEIRSTHGSQPRCMLSTDNRDHAPHM